MKEIVLSQGKIAVVDDEDYDYLMQWKWSAYINRTTKDYYACRVVKYRNGPGELHQKFISMHRTIMNTPKGLQCDHINHDTLDNRKENLRNVTVSQNQMNRKGPSKRNSIGVLGVQQSKTGFEARVCVNKKQIHFPVRSTLEEAIQDRLDAEKIYYGDFSSKYNSEHVLGKENIFENN